MDNLVRIAFSCPIEVLKTMVVEHQSKLHCKWCKDLIYYWDANKNLGKFILDHINFVQGLKIILWFLQNDFKFFFVENVKWSNQVGCVFID